MICLTEFLCALEKNAYSAIVSMCILLMTVQVDSFFRSASSIVNTFIFKILFQ